MKRSEMVKFLIDFDKYYPKGLYPEEDYWKNLIDICIISLGMHPPLSESSKTELNRLITDSEHVNGKLYDIENILSYIKWEPEDEDSLVENDINSLAPPFYVPIRLLPLLVSTSIHSA